jgi:hypothetical protein
MEVNNFDKLVKTVTDNILNRIDIQTGSNKMNDKSCLILIPNIAFGFNDYFGYIKKAYPDYDLYIGSKEEFSNTQSIEDENNICYVKYDFKNQMFINLLNSVENIVVLGLKINQLKELVETNDSEDINNVILGSLMVNKSINILLNSNELVFSKIANTVNEVRQLGINVTNIQQSNGSTFDNIELITERYVMELKNNGLQNLVLNKKQLITPLAKDKLREYKIGIEYIEEDKE